MVGNATHGVVRDAGRLGAANPCGVGKEGVKAAIAALENQESAALHFGEQVGTMMAWELTSSRSM